MRPIDKLLRSQAMATAALLACAIYARHGYYNMGAKWGIGEFKSGEGKRLRKRAARRVVIVELRIQALAA